MDEGHELDKFGLAAELLKAGYSLEESSCGLSSGLYFDGNLEKGLGSGVASSIFYYGLNCDGGGLHSSASEENENVSKYGNLDKMPSEDGAVDLYSAIGLSNASEELLWDIDFELSKKVPVLDYQFPQESVSWKSGLVSQSSGSSNEAVGLSESFRRTLDCQNKPPERLITRELDGNYMPSCIWEMQMNNEIALNSSYSYDLQCTGDVRNIADSVETGKSYHRGNQGFFGISPDQLHTWVSCTSSFMQCFDVIAVDEGTEAGDPSLKGDSADKLAYSCDLQDMSEVSQVDTSDSYNITNEGYFGTSYDLNHLVAPSTSLSLQCSDPSPVDENNKADDASLLSILIDKPVFSCDLQDLSEVSAGDTDESYDRSNGRYYGASHDLSYPMASCTSLTMQCCDSSLVDEDTGADDPSLQAGLINRSTCSFDPQDIGEVKNIASPVETSKSCHYSNQGHVTTTQLNCLGPLFTPLLAMQCCDANTGNDVTETDLPTLPGIVNVPEESCDIQDISQLNTVASSMETKESYHGSNERHFDDIGHDLNPLGMSFTSILTQFSDASLADEDADDPSLQAFFTSKPSDSRDPQNVDEANNVASLVDTGESHHNRSEEYAAISDDLDPNPQGLSCNSVDVRGTDTTPMVEDSKEDDDLTLRSLLIKKPAKCKRAGPHLRQKRVQKRIQRCTDDSPAFKARRLRKRIEEPTNSSKRKHVEAKSQNKRHRKRVKDGMLVAYDAVSRRSSKQDLDSDDEYDPFQSELKVRRSNKGGGDRRKNNKVWTLTEVIKLVDGISEFGVGKWTPIQRSLFNSPPFRTSLDIRDKWRNLIRTSAFRLKCRKEDETSSPKDDGPMLLPKSLLEKICELDSVHPYRRSSVKRSQKHDHDLLDSSSD